MAGSHTPATRELRAWCLAAAVGIADECRAGLLVLGADDGGDWGTTSALAGCGAPLVQLLARQAARIVARYEVTSSSAVNGPGRRASTCGDGGQQQQSISDGGGKAQPAPTGCGAGQDDDDLVLQRLDDLLSIAYTRFYAFLYKDLPLCWRQLYTDAAILKFGYLNLRLAAANDQRGPRSRPDSSLDEMVKTLDLALILAAGGGQARGRAWIDAAFELLERIHLPGTTRHAAAVNALNHKPAGDTTPVGNGALPPAAAKRTKPEAAPGSPPPPPPWDARPSFSSHEPFTPLVRHPIRRVPARELDLPAFQCYLDAAPRALGPQPLVLTGLADSWPARAARPWAKPAYLLSRTLGGRRLVPVEVGRSYVDTGWGQKIVRFADFLTEYVDPSASSISPPSSTSAQQDGPSAAAAAAAAKPPPIAYLAQHQLLLQLPHLRADIRIPDLCYTSPPPPAAAVAAQNNQPAEPAELAEPLLNAWFGPPGTITPLHTDPYHNLLVQVVGRKYVRLYAPQQTRRMRARGKEGGVAMGNTSRWDVGVVEGWDARPGEAGGASEDEEGQDGQEGQAHAEASAPHVKHADGLGAVPFVDCILAPGEALYIPTGWWHYVRGLSVSFSVSIWWN